MGRVTVKVYTRQKGRTDRKKKNGTRVKNKEVIASE